MLDNLSVGTKIVILVIIGVFIIGAIIAGLWYFTNREEGPTVPEVIDETQAPPREPISPTAPTQTINLPAMTDEEKNEEQLQTLARTFAERFGSFSNQGGFENLEDLKSISTDSMKVWLDGQRKDLMKKYPIDTQYYGVTTMAPISSVESYGEEAAVIIVTTQRTEKNNGDEKKYNQDLKVEFVKQDGRWLINGAFWK